MINSKRLGETFKTLVEIDSVSKKERKVAEELKKILDEMGAETFIDNAGEKIGGETGNLIAKMKGSKPVAPLLLNAHMDTVQPGEGVKAVLNAGVFTSEGETILGADDKSAVAILLETLRVLREDNIAHPPLEIVFTVCEEVGLQGAQHLDFSLISAKYGYTLDATDTEGIVIKAPAANKLEFIIRGKGAHAGAAPEKGINAIYITSKAIAALELGRIDEETTCNIGIIEGGMATNIVPNKVRVEGEVRSHSNEKLDAVTQSIVSTFEKTVDEYKRAASGNGLPTLETIVEEDFPRTELSENHYVVKLARKAAGNLGRQLEAKITGGGADANIFFQKGIMTGVLGTGMKDMHTARESVKLEDMVKTVELMLEIIKIHSEAA